MNNNQLFGDRVTATSIGSPGAVATLLAVTNGFNYVTDIAGSSDKAGSKIVVKDGSTVIWQNFLGQGTGTLVFQQSFQTPLRGSKGTLLTVTVDNTTNGTANVAGYTLADA